LIIFGLSFAKQLAHGLVKRFAGYVTLLNAFVLIREFYQREKAAGGFYFEELREKEEGDQEGYADEQRRIPEAVKMEVWRRDGGKCSKCGSRVKLEYDHIIPFSMGGSNTARNIELLCMDCNRKKSNRV
jgi:hypothetical protein